MFDSWPFWLEEEEEERTTTFCALIPSGASRAGRFRAWCKFSNRPIQRRRKRNGHVMSALPPFVYDLLAGTVILGRDSRGVGRVNLGGGYIFLVNLSVSLLACRRRRWRWDQRDAPTPQRSVPVEPMRRERRCRTDQMSWSWIGSVSHRCSSFIPVANGKAGRGDCPPWGNGRVNLPTQKSKESYGPRKRILTLPTARD
jgi:hypothetical protein